MTGRGERGQATVEVALLLPVLVGLALLVAQVALVARDRMLVSHAAREAARAAVVGGDPEAARRAAARVTALDPARLEVSTVRKGGLVTVIVSYRAVLNVPFLGSKSPEIRLHEQVTGHAEN
jgi:Flp pilus assembly protein TadG